jgi:8-oxo-dGTP pyrophosphatase MutT (NUDIX family)
MDGAMAFVFDKPKKKILLVKRRDVQIWVIPGGGIEDGETPEEAAVREVKEENGYEIEIVRKIAEYSWKGNGRKSYLYEGRVIGGKATLSNESKAVEFYEMTRLPELLHPLIPDWLQDYKKDSKKVIRREMQGVTIRQALKNIGKHPVIVIRFILVRMGIRINT